MQPAIRVRSLCCRLDSKIEQRVTNGPDAPQRAKATPQS
jgi:hypothetical protein